LALRREWLDIAAVAAAAFESCRWALGASGRTLAMQMPDVPVPAFVDPARIRQIVINLLEHAARSTDTFGAIGLALHASGDQVALQVLMRDRPAGHEVEDERESCAPGTDAWNSGLPGEIPLGLALAARLVAMHGGTLSTRTEANSGVGSILVRLPLRSSRPGIE
jgi:two-component system sensor histidine kinase BaeS